MRVRTMELRDCSGVGHKRRRDKLVRGAALGVRDEDRANMRGSGGQGQAILYKRSADAGMERRGKQGEFIRFRREARGCLAACPKVFRWCRRREKREMLERIKKDEEKGGGATFCTLP